MIRAIEGRPASAPLGTVMRRDTAGNPLFVAQLLRHLEGIDALVERDGELRLTAGDRAARRPGEREGAGRRPARRRSSRRWWRRCARPR